MLRPAHTNATPSKTLSKKYMPQTTYCRDCSITSISFEKVLNVVNPPHTPVISNILAFWLSNPPRSASAASTPISKHPSIFTAKVPVGNGVTAHPAVSRLTAYRADVPINPPAPAIIISFSISSL